MKYITLDTDTSNFFKPHIEIFACLPEICYVRVSPNTSLMSRNAFNKHNDTAIFLKVWKKMIHSLSHADLYEIISLVITNDMNWAYRSSLLTYQLFEMLFSWIDANIPWFGIMVIKFLMYF